MQSGQHQPRGTDPSRRGSRPTGYSGERRTPLRDREAGGLPVTFAVDMTGQPGRSISQAEPPRSGEITCHLQIILFDSSDTAIASLCRQMLRMP